jgi:peptidoglycan/LPS O-acetylase OafA/YrhL
MGSDYRKDIDGLRAVAVLSVLVYHYGESFPFALLPGGFTGVDVFFVISGFLITSQLATEIEGGEFSLLKFYDRRLRRIMPALIVMLLASILVGKFMLLPGDYRDLAASAVTAAFGASNFYFLSNTGYFDQPAEMMPLLHTWSLGVEEQFYLVWPVLLYLIAKGRPRHNIAAILATLMVVGFAIGVFWFNGDPKGAFFLALPRAWELAIGALLVFLPQLPRRLGETAAILGLALIGFGLLTVSATNFPGSAALYPCLGAALVVWPRRANTVSGFALGIFNPIGKISYSLYLWHWPVWVFFRVYINNGSPRIGEALALTALSIALAWLSWRFVEQPFRKPRWQPSTSVWAGLFASCVVLCVGGYVDSSDGIVARIPPDAYAMRSLDAMWQWPCGDQKSVAGLDVTCVFGADWNRAPTKAILWGDSHAEHLAPLIEKSALDAGASVALYRSCPAILDGLVKTFRPDLPGYNEACGSAREAAIATLAAHPEINLVILSASWQILSETIYVKSTAEMKQEIGASVVGQALQHTIEAIARAGRRIVVVSVIPGAVGDPVPCAVASMLLRRDCPAHSNTLSVVQNAAVNGPIDRQISSLSGAEIVIPSRHMCTKDYCLMELDGEFLHRDASHIRRNLSQRTRDDLAKLIGLSQIFDSLAPVANRSQPRG